MEIQFTVTGSTKSELEQRANDVLAKLLEGTAPDRVTLEVSPAAEETQGGVVLWEASVAAWA